MKRLVTGPLFAAPTVTLQVIPPAIAADEPALMPIYPYKPVWKLAKLARAGKGRKRYQAAFSQDD